MMTDLEKQDSLKVTVYYGDDQRNIKSVISETLGRILSDLSIMDLEDALFYEIERLKNENA